MPKIAAFFFLLCVWCPFSRAQSFVAWPDIHGDKIVFTAEGDLWTADIATGEAKRLTIDPAAEVEAHFSPDGTQIAFTGGYEGGFEAYVMPVGGGSPKRLTYSSGFVDVVGWTPDGKNVLIRDNTKMYASLVESWLTFELFKVSTAGGLPVKFPVPQASFASLHQDGRRLVYVPHSSESQSWYRYEAGQADSIWLADLERRTYKKLTDSKGVDTTPVWVGETVYFVSERSGVRNLWSLDPKTKAVKQLTFSTSDVVRTPSTDGKRVVYSIGPKIGLYDPATGKATVLDLHLRSDRIHARPAQVGVSSGQAVTIGPTGKRVAFVVSGQLVTLAAGDGAMDTIVNDSKHRVFGAAWSPDGKKIAYVSDASGEEQVWIADSDKVGAGVQLTQNLRLQNSNPVWSPDGKYLLLGNRHGEIRLVEVSSGTVKTVGKNESIGNKDRVMSDFAFSPDSKWVAYSTNNLEWVYRCSLHNIESGKSFPVTSGDIESGHPAFSPDGLFLYVVQARDLTLLEDNASSRVGNKYQDKLTAIALAASTPSPYAPKNEQETDATKKPEEADPLKMKVDPEGIVERTIDMKVSAGDYRAVLGLPNRILLVSPAGLLAYDVTAKSLTTLCAGVVSVTLSSDRKKLLVTTATSAQVVDATTGPFTTSQGTVKTDGKSVTVDPTGQWSQIFYESWRVARDFFYDPNMHGVDWEAVKAKYEARLPLLGSSNNLGGLILDMLAELNVGHCYFDGKSTYRFRPPQVASLGVDVEWDGAAGAYKITHILRGEAWSPENRSPFAEPGVNVREGDFLLKIGQQTLGVNDNPDEFLSGKAGQTITVTVGSKPTLDGAKTIPVVPLENDLALRLQDWVRTRREYVEKKTNGQVAYVYIPDMMPTGLAAFSRQYYPNNDHPAVIVDVRGNAGGFISGNLLGDLAGKITGYWAHRGGGAGRREDWAPVGHIVAVANEYTFSDGEYFSEYFKRLKVGPLVGHRTGGGEVGSGRGYRLVNGSMIYIPQYGAWTGNDWIVEGRGAVPDYEVEQDPAAVMAGQDPQLDKAIELALAAIRDRPVTKPVHPPYPVKKGGSRGGG